MEQSPYDVRLTSLVESSLALAPTTIKILYTEAGKPSSARNDHPTCPLANASGLSDKHLQLVPFEF